MADREAIAELFAEYAYANDTHNPDTLEGMFTDDAEFELSSAGERAVGPLTGRKNVVSFMRESFTAQTDQRRHVTTNFRYSDETDGAARVQAYLSLMVTDNGQLTAKCTGIYDTRVQLTEGTWLFTAMHIVLDSGF